MANQTAAQQVLNRYQSITDNNLNVSASLVFDPSLQAFRIMQTSDFANLNVTGNQTIQILWPTSTGINNSTPSTGTNGISTLTGVVLQPNNNCRGYYVQNLSPSNMYLLFNTGICSSQNFNVLLTSSGTSMSVWEDSYVRYTGVIIGSGSPLNFIAWNF